MKNILVQECIYEQFKHKLSEKKLNLGSYENFNLTETTSTQLKIIEDIIEKAKCEGVEVIKMEDITKSISASFLLENISIPLMEDLQSHVGLPVVYVQTFRTFKEAVNLLNSNNFKRDGATSYLYDEKKAALSIWSNSSAISFDMAFAAQTNLVWINNYEISPALWHPDNEHFKSMYIAQPFLIQLFEV